MFFRYKQICVHLYSSIICSQFRKCAIFWGLKSQWAQNKLQYSNWILCTDQSSFMGRLAFLKVICFIRNLKKKWFVSIARYLSLSSTCISWCLLWLSLLMEAWSIVKIAYRVVSSEMDMFYFSFLCLEIKCVNEKSRWTGFM